MKQIANKDWRLKTLYSIINKDSKKVLYTPNNIQSLVLKNKAQRKMILKARQFGISTHCLIDMFDDTIFGKNITSVILAHEQDSLKKLFRIIHRLYEFMPQNLKPKLDRGGGSKYELYFPINNSRIYCDLESRGDTINRLHVSECAFMKDQSKLFSTLQAVPINSGKVTIETTPNGMGNHFYDMWSDVDSVYAKMFFPWYMYPDYKIKKTSKIELTDEEKDFVNKAYRLFKIKISHDQILFRRFKKSELKLNNNEGVRVTFEQEYPEDENTCFLSSGNSVIDLMIVKKMMDSANKPIQDKGWIKVYDTPSKFKNYCIGADTSEGVGGDFSVGVCMEVESKKVVAKIRGQWKPFDFAHKLNELGKMFKPASNNYPEIAVERNNHGHAVLLELKEHIDYPNLYIHKDEKLGWKTDPITRPIMLNTFINAIDNEYLEIHDSEILNECITLINNNGKIEAAEGKHDDCIVASSICLQLIMNGHNLSLYENLEKRILL